MDPTIQGGRLYCQTELMGTTAYICLFQGPITAYIQIKRLLSSYAFSSTTDSHLQGFEYYLYYFLGGGGGVFTLSGTYNPTIQGPQFYRLSSWAPLTALSITIREKLTLGFRVFCYMFITRSNITK